MRKKIVAGNWKMFNDISESCSLVAEIKKNDATIPEAVTVVVCPPFPSLAAVSSVLQGSRIAVGAQNMSEHDQGAYTGEVSWKMLKSAGCLYVILGHSERRQYFHETDELINVKVKKAISGGLIPIVCVGEHLEEREKGITNQIIATQVKGVLRGLSEKEMNLVIVAYEPVWAIGTGKNATPVQAQEVHQLIRKLISQLYNWQIADSTTIQYGGSVKPDNAADLLAQDDIDGALVGGASLKAGAFLSIAAAADR
ncbi:MAG: triose-phosphate isomerase [Ignavibacteria bacterium]|nr:triose-phosphate isomerase [Ignavibacteria bacterium]